MYVFESLSQTALLGWLKPIIDEANVISPIFDGLVGFICIYDQRFPHACWPPVLKVYHFSYKENQTRKHVWIIPNQFPLM